jgi:hypothetical protein
MAIAFVLGNGISRNGLDLEKMRTVGAIYGCNGLYRDFTPDVLVATDRPIAHHIQQSGYSKEHKFYTRKPLSGLGGLSVLQKYYGFSSGPNAIGLAAEDKFDTVYLVGFDMGPATNQKFNNVYADSEFYKSSSAVPTYTGNWIRQIKAICQDYPKTQFIRVMGPTTQDILELHANPNMSTISLSDFIAFINIQKD